MNTHKIGVIGLGNMGLGMALSLQRAGLEVQGFDVHAATASHAHASGISTSASLQALASEVDVVVLSLPNSAIVEQVCIGAQSLQSWLAPGSLVIDTSTADPKSSRTLAAELAQSGIVFIDAPVSGGPGGAQNGALTMFIGGSAEAFEQAKPYLNAMGSKLFHIGETGAGNIAKIVNNLLTAAQLLTAGEAFRMAEAAGVRSDQLIEAVNAGSGRSGVTLFNYPNRILNNGFNSGFTMQLMRKDVRLAMDLLAAEQVPAPVMREVGAMWSDSASSLADGEDFNRIVHFVRP